MQNDIPTYETDAQRLATPKPDEAEDKLGSAQPKNDVVVAANGTVPVGVPTEFISAESRPISIMPTEAMPIETQPTDFMTREARP